MRASAVVKVPVGLGVFGVAVVFPGGDFVNQRLLVGNAAVEALRGQDAEFGFGDAILYRYKPEDNANIDRASPCEKNRLIANQFRSAT
jgi:hypothetical protein